MSPPYNHDAEAAIIGAGLTRPDLIEPLASIVTPTDLYVPAHQSAWAAIIDAHGRGEGVDATVIADRLRDVTAAPKVLAECIATYAGEEPTRTLAHRVADYAALRRVQSIVVGAAQSIHDNPTTDPATLTEQLHADLAAIDYRRVGEIDGLFSAREVLSTDFQTPPPIFPHFLHEMDRVLVVGTEGSGKSVLTAQWAAQAAAGKHPWLPLKTKPVSSLIIDCENPMHRVKAGLKLLPRPTDEWAPIHVWSKPQGINIRSRRDQSELHAVCERTQPKVIAIGPLYKVHRSEPGESDEDAAMRCQQVLDELRHRFGCALLIEHHAPKGSDSFRKMVPFGSSAWLRWPEYGWSLTPHQPASNHSMGRDTEGGKSLRLGEFRGDRITADIYKPARFDRGNVWPWMAYWPEGMPRVEEP